MRTPRKTIKLPLELSEARLLTWALDLAIEHHHCSTRDIKMLDVIQARLVAHLKPKRRSTKMQRRKVSP